MDAATKKKFLSNRGFVLFSVLAIIIILIAVFAPVLSGGIDPTAGDLRDAIMAPDATHMCGTDKMGRDIYSRVLYGARISLVSTFILVALVFVIGTALGVVSGYFGGWVDAVIMRIADMMIAFPGLVLAIAVAGMLGASMRNAIIAIALVTWPKYARMARSLVLKIRHTDFVYAAIVTGSSTWRMLWVQHMADASEVYAAEYEHDAGHHGGDGHRRHDDGAFGAVLPGLRRAAADAGMGRHVERGPRLHAVGALDDDLSWFCNLYHGRGLQYARR